MPVCRELRSTRIRDLALRYRAIAAITSILFGFSAIGACSEPTQPAHHPDAVAEIVRNAVQVSGRLSPRSDIVVAGSAATSQLVFASMSPGSLTTGDSVEIAPVGTNGASVGASMFDGGFDPVGIDAEGADSLSVAVFAGGAWHPVRLRIPSNRAPTVIRTSPARGRTDIALNQQIEIVFSQPLDGSTVTTRSIELFSSGTVVPATVALSAGRPWIVELVPTSALLPNTVYAIVVDGTIMDTNGSLLTAPISSDFETGTNETDTTPNTQVCDVDQSSPLPASSYVLTSVGSDVPPFLMPQVGKDSVFIDSGTLRFTGGTGYELFIREHGVWGGYHFGEYPLVGGYALCGGTINLYYGAPPHLLFLGSVSGAQVRLTIPDSEVWEEDDGSRVWTFTLTP
jgi:hypothetical protein